MQKTLLNVRMKGKSSPLRDSHQISLLILTEFKPTNLLLFPLNLSEIG